MGVLGAIAGGIASNAGNIWNVYQTLKGWQRDDWNTQRLFDREDNAVQRRVADLKAAGLSPVLAAGSAASSGQPIAQSHQTSLENPVGAYLSTVQQRKGIDQTEAQTELTKFQTATEAYKKMLMHGQINEIDQRIKNMQSEKAGLDLRNSWINADMASTIRLRDGQLNHLAKDTIRIGQQTELLKAQTAYEQTAIDKLITDTDNAKILRDMNLIDRDYRANLNKGKLYSSFINGSGFGGLLDRIAGASAILDNVFPQLSLDNYRDTWYYPKKDR